MKRERVRTFAKDATLSKLRQYTSPAFQHVAVLIREGSSGNRKKCVLCSKGNTRYRQTSYMCNICKIPLCTRRYGLRSDTCFNLWHETDDLIGSHENSNNKVKKAKIAHKPSGDEMEEEEHGDGESHNEFTDEDASFLGEHDQQEEGGGREESNRDKLQELVLPLLPAPLTTLTCSQLEEGKDKGGELLDEDHLDLDNNGLEGSAGGVVNIINRGMG